MRMDVIKTIMPTRRHRDNVGDNEPQVSNITNITIPLPHDTNIILDGIIVDPNHSQIMNSSTFMLFWSTKESTPHSTKVSLVDLSYLGAYRHKVPLSMMFGIVHFHRCQTGPELLTNIHEVIIITTSTTRRPHDRIYDLIAFMPIIFTTFDEVMDMITITPTMINP